MRYLRRYYDEDKDEEISEKQLRHGLAGTYHDVDIAIAAINDGGALRTAYATYWKDATRS